MAFEKLAPYIDQIERGFKDKKSPREIAKELGQPGLHVTIHRYKTAVWNLKDLVSDAKEKRAEKHDTKRNAAVDEIVNTLDLINLGKLRAKQLMSINLGDEFDTGEGTHKLTLGSASVYWPIGTRMMSESVRLEMELSGDDPESRKASALEDLSDAQLRAIVAATEITAEKEA
ncbi:MAG: hypothetical protein PHE11_07425 [Candidatus Omnitrophica bacterium]|jgi:hypothetical protein|nr:hypothetical protein [Candidatus Omnitrophota bacterium]